MSRDDEDLNQLSNQEQLEQFHLEVKATSLMVQIGLYLAAVAAFIVTLKTT
jgi:hypothetical protein